MFKRNEDIRKAKGVIPFWLIAEYLNVHENTVHNWMKSKMTVEQKARIMAAIEEIKSEMKKGSTL